MINPLDELSDIYLGQISEADNSPEAIKARVMQHVRAIRYRARKEGDQLNKAYNDYMAGQAGISATEKSMVKERLGLTGGAQHQEGMAYGLSRGTGKPSGPMAAFGKKKTKKTKPTVTIDKPDKLVSLRVSKEGYYSWRHELSEYSGMMPKKNGDAEEKITEKKVKNKVTVNPAQGQAESFAKELGGQLLEACEVFQIFEVDDDQIQLLEVKDRKGKGSGTKDACYHKVKSRYSVWPSAYASGALVKCRRVGAANWGNSTKKEDVQWKDIKYKAKSGESTFLSDSDGNIAFEIVDVIAPAVQEAKVDKGRSDYGKASIRNYRRMGPGHDTPGMFDPEGKRGKTIDKRREEHKARRGVKGAKVPAYKVDEGRLASLERASVLAMSNKPEDQDKAREIKTRFDYQSLRRQIKKSSTKESVEDIKDDKYNVSEEGLRDWFGKSSGTTKSGRKVKGWVQVGGKYDGKPCARQPGQKSTPKCVSSSKRRSMSKSERDSAARRKRAADPNQPQKSGAAKPTNVSTDPKKKMKESFVNEAKDKKGKGSGTKDACYHKVKSRYSVWPSAYASGALVKCRKVGAANWGNKSKNEGFSPMQVAALEAAGMIEIKEGQKCWKGYEKKGTKMMFGKRYNNCVKKKATKEEVEIQEMGNPSFEVKQTKTQKLQNMSKTDGPEGKIAKKKLEQKKDKEPKLPKLESYASVTEGVAFLKREKEKKNSSSKYLTQRDAGKLAKRKMAKKDQEKVNFLEPEETNESKTRLVKNGHTYKVVLTWRGKTYMVQMFVPSVSRPTRLEVEKEVQKLYPDAKVMSFLPRDLEPGEPTVMMGEEKRDEYGDIVGGPKISKKQKAKNLAKNEKDEDHTTTTAEEYVTEDDMKGMSVKSGHKRPTKAGAGMTKKGVMAYRRRNPGSKLKTAVTTKPSKLKKGSKAANRRKSYCARSAGQMKKFPKAAKDPNSRLRQARRRWKC